MFKHELLPLLAAPRPVGGPNDIGTSYRLRFIQHKGYTILLDVTDLAVYCVIHFDAQDPSIWCCDNRVPPHSFQTVGW